MNAFADLADNGINLPLVALILAGIFVAGAMFAALAVGPVAYRRGMRAGLHLLNPNTPRL